MGTNNGFIVSLVTGTKEKRANSIRSTYLVTKMQRVRKNMMKTPIILIGRIKMPENPSKPGLNATTISMTTK